MMMIYLFNLLGVFVFGISGALAAGRKGLDLLGVAVIAVVTAIGGGTLRDLLLDRHPIFWIADPNQLWAILAGAAFAVVWVRFRHPPERALLIADGIGLAFFAIAGAQLAEASALPGSIVVLMGVTTGVAGGVLRDVLTAEVPIVFRPGSLYATTAIAGVSLYLLLQLAGAPRDASALIGMVCIAGMRFAAILLGVGLPAFVVPDRAATIAPQETE
jgi:uncharacterized membrane protein YeiH